MALNLNLVRGLFMLTTAAVAAVVGKRAIDKKKVRAANVKAEQAKINGLIRQVKLNAENLVNLDLSDKKLSTDQMINLAKALEKNTNLKAINFGSNPKRVFINNDKGEMVAHDLAVRIVQPVPAPKLGFLTRMYNAIASVLSSIKKSIKGLFAKNEIQNVAFGNASTADIAAAMTGEYRPKFGPAKEPKFVAQYEQPAVAQRPQNDYVATPQLVRKLSA